MRRTLMLVLLAGALARAQEPADTTAREMPFRLIEGSRFTGLHQVTWSARTTVRKGDKVTESSESVQRTERFVDQVLRADSESVFEIERTYVASYVKRPSSADPDRKEVLRTPNHGRTFRITEQNRKRTIAAGPEDGGPEPDNFTRQTAGVDLDWRDILPDHVIHPGDNWDADATTLARRFAPYMDCGRQTTMKVRYVEDVELDGRKLAKLYVYWTLEGMRDRQLFVKVTLAGDVHYDYALQRVVKLELGGSLEIQGAILRGRVPEIIKGEGPVMLEFELKPAPVEAAAPAEAPAPVDAPAQDK